MTHVEKDPNFFHHQPNPPTDCNESLNDGHLSGARADQQTEGKDLIMTMLKRAAAVAGLGLVAAAMGTGVASAQTAQLPNIAPEAIGTPTIGGVQIAGALPQWDLRNGDAHARAAGDAIALAVAAQGGQVHASAENFSGPAGIAVGEGAQVHAHGVKPGLAIGIAGPNTTVTIPGNAPVTCEGTAAFAGDFQSLTGCVIYQGPQGPVSVPLSVKVPGYNS